MTIEEKAKAYDEALERAKKILCNINEYSDSCKNIETIFPELAASEDEKIRQAIIAVVQWAECFSASSITHENAETMLAWLEKQKEHLTPEEKMNHPLYLEGFDIGKRVGEITGKPTEWSEKKEFISDMISERLKSLRPQPHTVSIKDATKFGNLEYERGVKDGIQSEKSRHWKPSEEQMRAVFDASERNDKLGSVLRNLYDDLKKL